MKVFVPKSHFCIEDLGLDLTEEEIAKVTTSLPIRPIYEFYGRKYYESKWQEPLAIELGFPHRLIESKDTLSTEEYESHLISLSGRRMSGVAKAIDIEREMRTLRSQSKEFFSKGLKPKLMINDEVVAELDNLLMKFEPEKKEKDLSWLEELLESVNS